MKCLSSKKKTKKCKKIIKNIFENIKSNYVFQKIFKLLQYKKCLGIINFNKNIQKRINININDYKEYSTLYTPIEIDIIPIFRGHGKFIEKITLLKSQ